MQATVNVQPVKSAPAKALLQKVEVSSFQVRPGGTVNLTISSAEPAPQGGIELALTSSKTYVKLPATAVIPAAARSVTVPVQVDASAPNWVVFLRASSLNTVSTYVVVRAVR